MDKTDQARIVRAYFERLTAADYDAIVAMFEKDGWVDRLSSAKLPRRTFSPNSEKPPAETFSPSTMFFLEKTATASPLNSSMTGHWQAVTKSCFRASTISGSDRPANSRPCRSFTTPIRPVKALVTNTGDASVRTAIAEGPEAGPPLHRAEKDIGQRSPRHLQSGLGSSGWRPPLYFLHDERGSSRVTSPTIAKCEISPCRGSIETECGRPQAIKGQDGSRQFVLE